MIDWNRVSELREEVGPEDFDEVVDLFLDEVNEEIEKLRDRPENAGLGSLLHFLKGSALNLGFVEFAKLCQAGEQAAAQGQAEQIDLEAIVASYIASRAEFAGRLGRTRVA